MLGVSLTVCCEAHETWKRMSFWLYSFLCEVLQSLWAGRTRAPKLKLDLNNLPWKLGLELFFKYVDFICECLAAAELDLKKAEQRCWRVQCLDPCTLEPPWKWHPIMPSRWHAGGCCPSLWALLEKVMLETMIVSHTDSRHCKQPQNSFLAISFSGCGQRQPWNC